MKKKWIVWIGIVCLGLAVALLLKLRGKRVNIAQVDEGAAVEAVYASGVAEPVFQTVVKSTTSGRIERVWVDEGDSVAKDQPMAQFDDRVAKAELDRGEAELSGIKQRLKFSTDIEQLENTISAKRAVLNNAKNNLDRLETLQKSGAATPADLQNARTQVDSLNSEVAALLAQLKNIKINNTVDFRARSAFVESLRSRKNDTDILSPLQGTVYKRNVEPGEFVQVGAPMFVVANERFIRIRATVAEEDMPKIIPGQEVIVRFNADQNKIYNGKLDKIVPQMDTDTKSFRVYIHLNDTPKWLRAGMSCETNIIIQQTPNARLLPLEAVEFSSQNSSGQVTFYTMGSCDGIFCRWFGSPLQKITVASGIIDKTKGVVAIQGIAKGDQVVYPQKEISSGTKVLPGSLVDWSNGRLGKGD